MLHGLHLNFDFSAFCSVFIAFILVQVLTWEKSEMQFAFVYIMASVRSRCVFRDDPAESQQFHVWVKVSFSSVISQRNYKGKTVDGATADWRLLLASPMWSDACSLHPCCCIKQIYCICFRAIWLEDVAAVPAGPGFRIWFLAGFGAKKGGSLFAHLWRRGCFGSVTGLFEIEAFFPLLYFLITPAIGLTGDRTTVWKGVCVCVWCTYDLLYFMFYELVPK